MARLRNVILNVGNASSGNQFVDFSYDVDFEEIEIRLNMRFTEVMGLIDRDGQLDTFFPILGDDLGDLVPSVGRPSLAMAVSARGDRDDDIAFIGNSTPELLRPDGNATVHRSGHLELRFRDNERGPEEYRLLVIVTPEMWQTSAWSNEVSANLAAPSS